MKQICNNKKFRKFLENACALQSNYSMSNDTSLKTAVKDLKGFISKQIDIKKEINLPSIDNITEYKRVFEEVQHSLKVAKDLSKMSARISKILVLIVFVFVFLSAKSYHNKYLRDISYDNSYITNYFRRIDARRKKAVNLGQFGLQCITHVL